MIIPRISGSAHAELRRGDVDDPQGYARILIGDRGQPGQNRIRQVLVGHDADPEDVDKILAAVEP